MSGRSSGLDALRDCKSQEQRRGAQFVPELQARPPSWELNDKDQMRARGVPSPDEWDAVALTFAEPVSSTPSNFNRVIEYPKSSVA